LPTALETPPRPTKENIKEDENGIIEIDPTPRRPSRPITAAIDGVRVSRKREHSVSQHSPMKKRKLDEDGLVVLDGANDQMMDDVIVIDDD
jgi:ubiquitin-like 1-activating enzyme E1 B